MRPRTYTILVLALAAFSTVRLETQAASLFTETFTAGLGGWRGIASTEVLTNTVSGGNPGGALSITIPSPGNPGPPITYGIVATNNAFVGDYQEADATLIGFDIKETSSSNRGASVTIYLFSSTNRYERVLPNLIQNTGVWYRVRLSMLAPDLGGWTNVVGSYTGFSDALTNVTRLEILLPGLSGGDFDATRTYLVDNIFLARLPEAVSTTISSGQVVQTWLHLREGEPYRFEGAENPAIGPWSLLDAFVATGSVYSPVITTTNGAAIHRLLTE
ncbi:MAG TPA: hypothetical protein PKE12_14715 [Kiritimatiellia bacterium]|nr:hypothetical protein [Kiritimatiellia bacterium]